MDDRAKSKAQLIEELKELRGRVAATVQTGGEDRWRQEGFRGLINGFLSLGMDPAHNIARLTALCGELLHGTCALYNRLEEGMLCSAGHWNVPPDYESVDAPDGHICFDVISKGRDETMVVRGLPQTPYAETDPNVMKYGLQTYVGHAVKLGDTCVGSLCVVYTEDVVPTENDRLLIQTIASAIAREERRKHAEDTLSSQVQFLQTLMEAIPDPVFYKGVDGKYLGCNSAFADLVGLTRDDVVGRTVHEVAPDEVSRTWWQKDRELFGNPQVQMFEFGKKDANGVSQFMRVHKAPFFKPDGTLAGLIGVMVDITDRTMREAELSTNLAFVQTLIDAIPNPVYYKDDKGTYLGCNKAFTEWVGHPEQEIIGKTAHGVVAGRFADMYHQQDLETLAHPGVGVFESSSLHPDGSVRSTIVSKSTFANFDGSVRGLIGVISDVSNLKRAEEALRLERQQLVSIFDSINEVIFVVDIETYEILYTNKFMKHGLGKELHGSFCFKELHGLHGPCSHCGIAMAKSLQGEPYRWEYHNPTNNRDYLATDRIIKWTNGRDAKFHLGIDVTERKKAEVEREKSLSLLQATLESTADGILVIDNEGRNIAHNREFARMWRIPYHVLESRNDDEALSFVVHQLKDSEDFLRKVRDLYSQPDAESFDVLEFKDGRIFERYSQPQRLGGNIVGRVWSFRDVTTRRQEEEALRRQYELQRALLAAIPAYVYFKDVNSVYLAGNKRFSELSGVPENEIPGKTDHDFFSQTAADSFRENDSEIIATGKPRLDYEMKGTDAEGNIIWFSTSKAPFYGGSGEIAGLVGISIDITERKREEEERKGLRAQLFQSQKMEAIGTLTGGVAHDFNNLLTIVNGYTELILSEKTEDDPSYSDLKKIMETGLKGAEMVQSLLAFSKKSEIRPQPLDLNVVTQSLASLMARTFPKTIEIQTILGKDLSMVNADALQVEQVLMNLCINAKEAMPEGGQLRIETRNTLVDEAYCRFHTGARPGRHVLIEISDTGTGMGKGTMERMFDPFFTTKGWDFKKGTGLGLSVAKGIVEQHCGWLTCESDRGRGTKFTLYFPVIRDLQTIDKRELLAETVPDSGSILLVDDEEYVRDLGKRFLERAGYTVITAADGKEALGLYSREWQNIALVVLDLIMPQMGGEKCLEGLLKINPQVKVIISTGHSLAPTERVLLGAHAKGFVNKPYKMRELLEVVTRVREPE